MLEGVLSMQNLISDPVSMTSCRQEAYLLRLRRQFPFVSFAWCPAVMSSLRLPEPNCSAYTLRPKAVRVSVLT